MPRVRAPSSTMLAPSLPRRACGPRKLSCVLVALTAMLTICIGVYLFLPSLLVSSPHISFISFGLFSPSRQSPSQPSVGSSSLSLPSRPILTPLCHVVGFDAQKPSNWLFNSRAFCLTSAICLRPSTRDTLPALYTSVPIGQSRCTQDHPSLTSTRPLTTQTCSELSRKKIYCAHGKYGGMNEPQCPTTHALADLSTRDINTARRIDNVAIVVPAFPYLENIFHFSFVAGLLLQVTTALPQLQHDWNASQGSSALSHLPKRRGPQNVTIVFRGQSPRQLGVWQYSVFNILKRRVLSTAYMRVSVHALNEDPLSAETGGTNGQRVLCAQSAVLLGNRGNVNLWPFANGSALSHKGDSVPDAAVTFRRAFYKEFGITARLPVVPNGPMKDSAHMMFDLPPLILLYARRNARKDPKKGKPITGATRRFSDADELWFGKMLREEGSRVGVKVRELRLRGGENLETQVRAYESAGLVVGIHGANLVNAMFTRPFAGLLEIFPGGAILNCYRAGANAGLAYWMHEAEKATPEESHCGGWHKDCWKVFRQRRVKIDHERHRSEIREKIKMGLRYLKGLHTRFPDGIPTRYDHEQARFVVLGTE